MKKYNPFNPNSIVSTNLYPESTEAIIKTLIDLLSNLGHKQIAELVLQSQVSVDLIEHDNWNGGFDYYSLNLRTPTNIFAGIEDTHRQIEKLLLEKIKVITCINDRDIITQVKIIPESQVFSGTNNTALLTPYDTNRIWGDTGSFKLFLTHLAKDKIIAAELKQKLANYGISSFIAHEDIEPSLVFQNEIELALASMDALVALITPDFNLSFWCHQEIGFALGRNIPVVSVRVGSDPCGFIGKYQAIPGYGKDPKILAVELVNLFLTNINLKTKIIDALVTRFEGAETFDHANESVKILKKLGRVSPSIIERLEKAMTQNKIVKKAYGATNLDNYINRWKEEQREAVSKM